MKLHRQIKALLFLTIMSLFTAHNVLPHAHHLTTSHAEDHEHTDHHHHGHSHENGQQSSGENSGNFLTLLLESHAHSAHTHVYFTLADAVNKVNKSPLSIAPADVFSTELLLRKKEPDRQQQYLLEIFYDDNPALNNCPLRAPPAFA